MALRRVPARAWAIPFCATLAVAAPASWTSTRLPALKLHRAAQAPHPSPDSLAFEFQRALMAQGWRAVAARLHPDALKAFQQWVNELLEADASGRTRRGIFGDLSGEEVRDLPPDKVFVRAMTRLGRDMPGLLHALVAREVRILGAVSEPPDLAHVVYRNTDQLAGAVSEVRVMTLKRLSSGWRVLDTQELDLVREALRGIAHRREPPPPPNRPFP